MLFLNSCLQFGLKTKLLTEWSFFSKRWYSRNSLGLLFWGFFPRLISKIDNFKYLRTDVKIYWHIRFHLYDRTFILLIILNFQFYSLDERLPLSNINVKIVHFSRENKFRCKALLVSYDFVVVNFSCFNIDNRIKLIIIIINKVKCKSKRVKLKCTQTLLCFRLLIRYLSFKICIKFSIVVY